MKRLSIIVMLLLLTIFSNVSAKELAPYKNDLFKYPGIMESSYNGDYLRIDYREKRDIEDRDEIDGKKANSEYVSLDVNKYQQDLSVGKGKSATRYILVGSPSKNTEYAVVYMHGLNGTRFQGVDDLMFGGNFNRIKNLMVNNGGLYISPDFTDFSKKGNDDVFSVMSEIRKSSPKVKFFLSCGSSGGALCWSLAKDKRTDGMIAGLLLLGSTSDYSFTDTAAFKKKIPVYLGHGGKDSLINWKGQEGLFKKLKLKDSKYPTKLVIFNTGGHGIPIRMTDWREILNWMLANQPKN